MAKDKKMGSETPGAGATFLTEEGGEVSRRQRLRSLSIAERRRLLRDKRGTDVSKLSDEEVETLWTSLDELQQWAYLAPEA